MHLYTDPLECANRVQEIKEYFTRRWALWKENEGSTKDIFTYKLILQESHNLVAEGKEICYLFVCMKRLKKKCKNHEASRNKKVCYEDQRKDTKAEELKFKLSSLIKRNLTWALGTFESFD